MQNLAISNAHARAVAKSGPRISDAKLPDGYYHHITHDLADLKDIVGRAKADRVKHIVIEGGDGTVRTVMTLLLNRYDKADPFPAISILPGGTTNQIARNLGLKKASDLSMIARGQIKALTTPLIKIKTMAKPNRYGFLFSTGALPHVSRFAQDKLNEKGIGGGTAVVGAVIKAVTSDKDSLMPPQKHRLKAKADNSIIINHKGKALGTIMTTLPSLMLGLDPFWGEEEAPLRVTWAEAESRKLASTVAGLWVGRKKDRTEFGYHSHNVDRLLIKTKAPATLDGDFLDDLRGVKFKVSTSRPITFWQATS